MIILCLETARFRRAHSQTFNIICTERRQIIDILGSTGNAYRISIKTKSLKCNCPDQAPACKHIIFLLSITGFLKKRQSHITINPQSLLQHLAQNPLPQFQACLLDPRTSKLCSAHRYPTCFFCAKNHYGSIIVCSECGYLAHKKCYQMYLQTNVDFDKQFCPKCGFEFTPLDSNFQNGYRNFFFVLKHNNYRTLSNDNPSSSHLHHPTNHTLLDDNPFSSHLHQSVDQISTSC